MSVEEIHDEVNGTVSTRTIYRDLEDLKEIGFQLEEINSRWKISNNSGIRSFPIPESEIMALLLSEDILLSAEETWIHKSIVDLRERLSSLLTEKGRAWIQRCKKTLIGTLSSKIVYKEQAEILEQIEDAIQEDQQILIDYQAPNRPSGERIIDPYLLWLYEGRLYLVAFCNKSKNFKTFAIQRIKKTSIMESTFERKADFNIDDFTKIGIGTFHGQAHSFVIDFSPEVAYLFRERRYHASQTVEEKPDGWLRVTLTCAGLPEVAIWIAGFGGNSKPIAPPALIARVRQLHLEGLQRLEDASCSTPPSSS